MTKIAIQIDGIIRNSNKQILKYYVKDINKDFDDKNIDVNINNFIGTLPFKSQKEREKFLYEDYAFEVYGSANAMSKGLMVKLNEWLLKLHSSKDTDADIFLFGIKMHDIALQSTYFFLGKLGCRIRKVLFPIDSKDIWNDADVVITNNKHIIFNKPKNKVVIFIKNNSDNYALEEKCDFKYNNLVELIEDKSFIPTIHKTLEARASKSIDLISKITNKIKNILS